MKILLLILCFLCIGCKSQVSCKQENYIYEYSKGDFLSELPPVNSNLIMVIKTMDNKIVLTNNFFLYRIYSIDFKSQFTNFTEFICALLCEKIFVSSKQFKEDLKVSDWNQSVKILYEAEKLKSIFNKYFIYLSSKSFKLKRGINNDELYTVLYYVFINQYYITYSDYTGDYNFLPYGAECAVNQ
jgi:hypothetical protein